VEEVENLHAGLPSMAERSIKSICLIDWLIIIVSMFQTVMKVLSHRISCIEANLTTDEACYIKFATGDTGYLVLIVGTWNFEPKWASTCRCNAVQQLTMHC